MAVIIVNAAYDKGWDWAAIIVRWVGTDTECTLRCTPATVNGKVRERYLTPSGYRYGDPQRLRCVKKWVWTDRRNLWLS